MPSFPGVRLRPMGGDSRYRDHRDERHRHDICSGAYCLDRALPVSETGYV